MNPNAAPGVNVTADVGATVPGLGWIATALLTGGAFLLIAGEEARAETWGQRLAETVIGRASASKG